MGYIFTVNFDRNVWFCSIWDNKHDKDIKMDWDDMIIYKEIAFVYIVNGEKFFSKEEAEKYLSKKIKENKDEK